jgi:hypothetical protein
MSSVGFEPTIPAFGRAKTVHALDRAATVIGSGVTLLSKQLQICQLFLTVTERGLYFWEEHTSSAVELSSVKRSGCAYSPHVGQEKQKEF